MTGRRPLQKKPALRRFRPPANAAIFISEERYLAAEAGDWGQSPLPGNKIRGQIVDQVGPFLLSGNWWDEKAWARAEYDMQLEGGELVRAHEHDQQWRLDGIYD